MIIGIFACLGFALSLTEDACSMNARVRGMYIGSLSKKFTETGLDKYYVKIAEIKKEANKNPENAKIYLQTALKIISDAFKIIETKWQNPLNMQEDPVSQKANCRRALRELYQIVSEDFQKDNSKEADKIRADLRNLGLNVPEQVETLGKTVTLLAKETLMDSPLNMGHVITANNSENQESAT